VGVGGAGNWREEYNSFFKGLEVYLFYDNDKAGRNDVYIRAINLLPVAKSLLLVELPLPYKPEQGNDVTDYVEAGHGYDDIVSIMNAAPVLTSVDEIRESLGLAEQQQPEAGEEVKIGKTGSVFIQRFSSIQAKQVKWLMADYFPFSKPVIIDGEGGSGKSTLAISIAAPVTQGGPMPLNLQSDLDGPAGVIILSAEDDPADTIKPRLVAAGADVDRVAVITAVKRKDEFIEDITVKDLDAIKVAVQEMGAKLVIIDPLMSYLPESSKTDSYKSQDIRRILKPLARLAQELEIVIIIIRHYVKAKVTNPHAKGMGSIDIVNFLRGSLSVWPDPDDKEHERCILAITKPNLTSKKTPSLVYSLAVKTIEVDGVICKNIPYAVWHGTSKYLARELAKGRIFDDEEENAVKVEEGKMKVLEEVMNWKGSELIKRSELHAMVRLGTDRVDTYAKMLVDEEKLIRLGEGKSYSPYRYLANVFRFSIGGGKQVIRSKTKRLTMYGIVCSRDPLTGKPTQWFFPDGYSGPERKEN
jgi:AAA domain